MTLSARLFEEYTVYVYVSIPDSNPPLFVPLCNFDINKLGIDRMQERLAEQRLTRLDPLVSIRSLVISRSSTAGVALLPSGSVLDIDLFDEYVSFTNVSGSDPPPFVSLCDVLTNRSGFDRMQV